MHEQGKRSNRLIRPLQQALFTIFCAQIDRDHKKYEERCERYVANTKKQY